MPPPAPEKTRPQHDSKVSELMSVCNCTEKDAIRLLNHCNNDVEQAKIRHDIELLYGLPTSAGSHLNHEPEYYSLSDDHSDDDPTLVTPPPKDDLRHNDDLSNSYEPDRKFEKKQGHESQDCSLSSVHDETQAGEPDTEIEEPPWTFVLPHIPPIQKLKPGVMDSIDRFSMQELIGACQRLQMQYVMDYLARHGPDIVQKHINDAFEGWPSIFFAVYTNNEAIIRAWVAHGADVNAVHETSGFPLIAAVIMMTEQHDMDTTLAVSTLLSLGARSDSIPGAFYTPFIHDLPIDGPSDDELKKDMEDKTKSWCTPGIRRTLARTANLTQRYYLDRAAKAKPPSTRHKQVAKLKNTEALLGIPYFLIGQTMATNRIFQKLLNYMVVPTKRPLVMVFAGPSGHGKTELARALGHLMNLELEIVDCTIYNREIELFGPRNPYVGAQEGSPLNNFLARNAGKRCIVFLDEFEKTTKDIHQALLVPFDNGEYQDRRDLKQVDCSKTIWILATNALDSTIKNFCKKHQKPIFEDGDEPEKLKLMKALTKEMKQTFLSYFGSPVTGRISDFLPFLPFSPGEQAVVVHKFILELGSRIRGPVNLSLGSNEQILGNIRMKIRKDASVCRILAETEYHSDLGARSLLTGARKLEDLVVEAYLDLDGDILESEKMVDFLVDVDVDGEEVVGRMIQ